MPETRHIQAAYDAEVGVWWAESRDIPGLVSGAATFDGLVVRVMEVAGELLAAQGVVSGEVRLEFTTARQLHIV